MTWSRISPINRVFTVFGILIIIVVLDQWTKAIAREIFRGRPPLIYFDNLFRIEYSENPGAFLGLGSDLSPTARFWVFSVAISIFLMGALLYIIRKQPDFWNTLGISLLIGGGIGNVIDRISYGYVTDFMNMGIGGLRTGIFNIADMVIVAGVVVLFFEPMFKNKSKR